MPANKYYFLQGKAKWFRPDKPNQWGKYEHVLYLDAKSVDIIRELQTSTEQVQGIKNVLKKDEDGYFIRLARPASKTIKGRIVTFNPPLVFEKDGKTPLKNVYVGNGSDVTTKIEVYQHRVPAGGHAKALRWESTRVDNLIPFEMATDFDEQEQKMVRGFHEAPDQRQVQF